MQDIAVEPRRPDPSLNTVECVIEGHGKAPKFAWPKQLFHVVCWCILCISLVFSQFASQWLIVKLKDWNNQESERGKVEAVMLLSFSVFVLGLILIFFAWDHSNYVCVFSVFVLVVLVRRALWCIGLHCCIDKRRLVGRQSKYHYFDWFTFSKGHEVPSKNAFSLLVLYPAVFMACHHLLWILLGVITEPFWGLSVFVAVLSVSATFFFLTCEFYKDFPADERTCTCNRCLGCNKCCGWNYCIPFFLSLILVIMGFLAFLLLIFTLLVVAQSFLSESLISTLFQNSAVFISTVWLGKNGYLNLSRAMEVKGKIPKTTTKNAADEECVDLQIVNGENETNR